MNQDRSRVCVCTHAHEGAECACGCTIFETEYDADRIAGRKPYLGNRIMVNAKQPYPIRVGTQPIS